MQCQKVETMTVGTRDTSIRSTTATLRNSTYEIIFPSNQSACCVMEQKLSIELCVDPLAHFPLDHALSFMVPLLDKSFLYPCICCLSLSQQFPSPLFSTEPPELLIS